MNDSVQHLVLTRFNLHFPKWKDFRGLNPAWLDRRFALFTDICFPSVKAQTCQDFTWLVFFHPGTPQRHKAMIETLSHAYPNFVPVFATGIDGVRTSTRAMISKPFLITSRLDNDDALAPGYVTAVQRSHSFRRMQFINLSNGFYVDTRSRQVCRYRYPANMFLSLVEDTRHSRRTVLDFDHSRVGRDHKVLDLDAPNPGWLVVVHGGNKTTRMRGTAVAPALLSKYFPDVTVRWRAR